MPRASAPSRAVDEAAGALQAAVRLFIQRLRQTGTGLEGGLTSPETSAMARLDRTGPISSAELARLERISPQSIGATLAVLEERGLVARQADPLDGRRALLSLTPAGNELLGRRRSARSELLSQTLAAHFSEAEIKLLRDAAPLIERLAERI